MQNHKLAIGRTLYTGQNLNCHQVQSGLILNQGDFTISLLPASPQPFTALSAEREFAQLQLIELPITFSRPFTRYQNLQRLILTRQVRRLGARNDKDEDRVNPRWMSLEACGHIT